MEDLWYLVELFEIPFNSGNKQLVFSTSTTQLQIDLASVIMSCSTYQIVITSMAFVNESLSQSGLNSSLIFTESSNLIYLSDSNVVTSLGDLATISCSSDGDFYYWAFFKDGSEIYNVTLTPTVNSTSQENGRFSFHSSNRKIDFQISNVSFTDAGLYTCVATCRVDEAMNNLSAIMDNRHNVYLIVASKYCLSYV